MLFGYPRIQFLALVGGMFKRIYYDSLEINELYQELFRHCFGFVVFHALQYIIYNIEHFEDKSYMNLISSTHCFRFIESTYVVL